ncbi:hypothetical protein KC930_01425 [Candidatus Saccharibacteria bacterium]|nr:hypothetical protein [Candidatus Saccharibacteria bacterium]
MSKNKSALIVVFSILLQVSFWVIPGVYLLNKADDNGKSTLDMSGKTTEVNNDCLSAKTNLQNVGYIEYTGDPSAICPEVVRYSILDIGNGKNLVANISYNLTKSPPTLPTYDKSQPKSAKDLKVNETVFTSEYFDNNCCFLGNSYSYYRIYNLGLSNGKYLKIDASYSETGGNYMTAFYKNIDSEVDTALSELTIEGL